MKKIIKFTISILIFILIKILEKIYNRKFKFVFIYTSRFGHIIRTLDVISSKDFFFIIDHEKKISNHYILKNLKKKRNVISLFKTNKIISICNSFNITKNLTYDFNYFESNFHKLYVRPPLVTFPKEDELNFTYLCKKKKIQSDFVNFHNRDDLYLSTKNINDDNYHSFRNFEFKDFSKAINYLSKNNSVIRTGAKHKKFITNNTKFYDLTNKNYDERDLIFYYKYSKYNVMAFDGTTLLAAAFRKKSLYVNLIPFNIDIICNLSPGSIFIPKKIFSKELGRNLTFCEMNDLNLNVHTSKKIFQKNDLKVINNSQDDILNGVIEMEKKSKSNDNYSKNEKELNNEFWNIFNTKEHKKVNYYKNELKIMISPKFLSNNIDLLN